MRLGINQQAFITASFLLFSASAAGQQGKSFKYHINGDLKKSDVFSEKQSLYINYSISEINIENVTNDQGAFYRVSIPDHTPTSVPGKPELPVFSRLITIPEGYVCKISISEIKTTKIKPSKEKFGGILYPSQGSQTKEIQTKKPEFRIDRNVYASKSTIISDTVHIEPLGTVRGKKLANIYVYPVRYNPHSNHLEVITSMKIEVTYNLTEKAGSKSLVSESALFNGSLEKGSLNYNTGDVIPGYSEQPVTMVIITDTAFKKQLAPFLQWKTQKGYNLKVLYKGTGLAGNTYTQLKDTLTKIYNGTALTGAPPEFLLIIGDTKRIPYYGTGRISDMYYGEFSGSGDYIPEMYIGRLPVSDTSQLKIIISKLIQYEKFQFADTNKFYSRAIVSGGFDGGYASYMNGQVSYAINNYINPANGISEYHFKYPQSSAATVKDSLRKIINKGVSFINYTGHGLSSGWLLHSLNSDTSNIYSYNIPAFNNKNMYPFIISNACQTARFSDTTSFGNKMVLATDKGAIGFIGCSSDSYWDEDFYWSVGTGTPSSDPTYLTTGLGAYDRLFHTHGESPSNWYFSMGQITYAGNLAVSASSTNASMKQYYWETYNLIGDPSVIPIIGTPGHFNTTLPDILPNGIRTITLAVDPFAYVAVSRADKLLDASYASPSGSVTLEIPDLSNDSCLIVITGQNKVPIIKTIHFASITNDYINLTSTSLSDTQGNNNGLADFGEKCYLNLKISNLGLTNATGLYAKITTASKWVTINKDSAYIGTLAARSEYVLSDALGITISAIVPDNERIAFTLILKYATSSKSYSVDVIAHAPDLQILSCLMDDSVLGNGNHIADPGETFYLIFKIKNSGSSSISGQFNITGAAPVEIVDQSVKSGSLKFGEITDIPVRVKIPETVSSGRSITVTATLDCNPYILNKEFTFRVGRIRESFEASSFNIFPWINVSTTPWIITSANAFDGSISARSGEIPDSGKTSLIIKTVYSSADSVKFYYKVSSEAGYDYLSFRLNGTEIFKKSGEIDWTKKVVAVSAGMNKLEWVYDKDPSDPPNSSFSDCAWIDMVDFAATATVSYIQKDLQTARIVTPVEKDKYGKAFVTAKMLNLGREVVNTFNLAYVVNNQMPVKQTFSSPLVPFGDSVSVSFLTKADFSKYGLYNLIVYGYDNNDQYTLNDTIYIKIDNSEIKDSITIFPNPFTDQFTLLINSKGVDNIKISITNMSGVKLYDIEKSIIAGKNPIVITNLKLMPSIYYINISGTLVNKTLRILKVNK